MRDVVAVAMVVSVLALVVSPASAAGSLSITVTSAPNPVAPGQALTYTITATNTGGATATGATINDTLRALGPGNLVTAPYITTNVGSCTYNTGQVTCTAASLGAGQVWTVNISGVVTAAASTTVPDTATVTGTESSAQVSASGTTTTAVAQNVQPGFAQSLLAHGLNKPTVIAFAPGGDIYLGEQGGTILIYRNGAVLPTPVVALPNVYSTGETGLLGLAFDPNFSTNGYLYASYTVNVTNQQGVVQPFSQLSRFTVINSTINPATEKVLYRGNQAQNVHHAANTIKVGPDGKLWWSVGDNVPSISNAHALTNIYGKILRFNLDGSIPPDNPFVNVPGAVKAIYATGMRNAFRFSFLPNGQVMTENTGSPYVADAWEDLYTIHPGDNFGWPYYSGYCGSCGYLNPTYEYGHLPRDGAASAVAAYSGTAFPAQYNHVVFVGDYNRRAIQAIAFDPTYQTEVSDTVFDSTAGTIADLEQGPDGSLYFASIFEGTFSKISAVGPFPPSASMATTPNAGNAPLPVQFSSAGSSDPYGKPVTYAWDFGDGSASSTDPNPSHTYTTNGTYTATLTVSNGAQTGGATTRVVVGHSPPVASISAPGTYNAGDTIPFSGTATDANDGVLPGYAYTWKADFISNGVVQPSYIADVAHPFYGPTTGVTSGSFQIPTDPYQTPSSFYRITLTVTDSLGITTVVTKDLHPNLTTWSTAANVPGAGYVVDGTWHTGPGSIQDVVGVHHVLAGMPYAQTIGGTRYRFSGWADGSALTDSITATAPGGSYTANYDPVSTTVPAPWQSVDVGAPIAAGAADYSSGTQTFYVDGAGADAYGKNDQSHYVSQSLAGDGTIIARVRYQTNSDPWAKAGVMIRQSPTTGAPFVDALVTPDVSPNTPNINGVACSPNGCISPLPANTPAVGNGVRMQYSGSHSVTPANLPGYSSPNKWLKLQRAGNNFTSWQSTDGTHWTQIGIATVAMTSPVTIGSFVTSHDIGQYSTVAFDNVQVTGASGPPPPGPLPTPWVDGDVGAPATAGSASYTNPVFTVQGAGTDIWGTNDQFNYVSQPTSGNGTLIARVTSQSNTSTNAKAGIIFKQSTTAGSPYILIAMAPGGGVKVQYNFNGSTAGGTYTFPNVWMKLTRLNNTFTAYLSADGTNWNLVASQTLTISTNATAGLFVCSHNATALGTATFDNVTYTPGP